MTLYRTAVFSSYYTLSPSLMTSLGELSTLLNDTCFCLTNPRALFVLPTAVYPRLPIEDLGTLFNDSLYRTTGFPSYYALSPSFMTSLGELSTLLNDACLCLSSPRALFILPTAVYLPSPNIEDLGTLFNDSLYRTAVFSSLYTPSPSLMTSLGELSTLLNDTCLCLPSKRAPFTIVETIETPQGSSNPTR